ncbi:MAG: CBS domain-containing protein [Thermoplasmatota archaeon]
MRKTAVTVDPETTLDEVARLMVTKNVGCVVVTNARGYAQGVLTVRDFVPHDPANPFNPDLAHRVFGKSILKHGLETLYREARILTAGKMMRPLNLVLAEDDPVERGVDLMLRHDVTHVPVLRGHKAVGSVSRHDLLKVVLAVARPQEARAA